MSSLILFADRAKERLRTADAIAKLRHVHPPLLVRSVWAEKDVGCGVIANVKLAVWQANDLFAVHLQKQRPRGSAGVDEAIPMEAIRGVQGSALENLVVAPVRAQDSRFPVAEIERGISPGGRAHEGGQSKVRLRPLVRHTIPALQAPVCSIVPIGLFGETGCGFGAGGTVQIEVGD